MPLKRSSDTVTFQKTSRGLYASAVDYHCVHTAIIGVIWTHQQNSYDSVWNFTALRHWPYNVTTTCISERKSSSYFFLILKVRNRVEMKLHLRFIMLRGHRRFVYFNGRCMISFRKRLGVTKLFFFKETTNVPQVSFYLAKFISLKQILMPETK